MHVHGMSILVVLQLKVGISPSSNGGEEMVVNGISGLVLTQLVVDISPSSNGRERTAALICPVILRIIDVHDVPQF